MSTKTQTSSNSSNTNQINYDPNSLLQYRTNLGAFLPTVRAYAQSPYSNPFFQANLGMLNQQAAGAGQTNMSNILNNAKQLGFGGSSMTPFLQSQMNAAARGTSSLMNQGRFQAMNQANQQQMTSLGLLASWNPLMTGSSGTSNSNTTQTQSGLGTWLPQLAGAAIGGLTGGLTGGLSSLGSTAVRGAGMVSSAQMPNPFNADMMGGGGYWQSIGNVGQSAPNPLLAMGHS